MPDKPNQELGRLLIGVVSRALDDVAQLGLGVHTIVFFHEPDSGAVSVCVDTVDNSRAVVEEINAFNIRHFLKTVRGGDLDSARLWQANVGRNLSVSDFAAVNLGRTELEDMDQDPDLFLLMVRALFSQHARIRALSADPERTVLGCSGPNAEVELIWSLPESLLTDEEDLDSETEEDFQ